MEEFEQRSRLGIGNEGVRAKFGAWNRKRRILSKVPTLGFGNERVQAKFEACNWEWRSSSQVRCLESEMEEFERSSDAWNRERKCLRQLRVRVRVRPCRGCDPALIMNSILKTRTLHM